MKNAFWGRGQSRERLFLGWVKFAPAGAWAPGGFHSTLTPACPQRNGKEIASQLGTTEQVIKNYLRNVYDKIGVSDRLELALFTIHHRILNEAAAATAAASTPPQGAGVPS